MIIPIGVDVPFDRRPFLNWLVVIATVVVFGLQIAAAASGEVEAVWEFLLNGKGSFLQGLFGHMWIHGGIIHIFGNMLFLWVFGNAVCSKIGNVMYLPVYILLGLAAAFSFNMFSSDPMAGASGAVNGIVGMYLVFFPLNDITCFYWFYTFGTFSLSSYWMILFWLAFDIYGVVAASTADAAIASGGGVAYTAHLGGLLTGIAIAVVLLKLRIVVMEDDERSLLQVFGMSLEPKRKSARWEHVKPSGPREEAILRAAKARELADQEDEYYDEDYGIDYPPEKEIIVPKIKLELVQEGDGYIRFACHCGKKLKMPGKYAGKKGKCPRCATRVQIPG